MKNMVCASLAESERGGLDHYKYVADQLNIAGEKVKKAGMQLCYHNHDFEFVKQGDQYPYDILRATDSDLVKMEMDIYWVSKAGQDPVSLFKQHPGRFPLWHVIGFLPGEASGPASSIRGEKIWRSPSK